MCGIRVRKHSLHILDNPVLKTFRPIVPSSFLALLDIVIQTHTSKNHLQQGQAFCARMWHRRVPELSTFQSRVTTVIDKHSLHLPQKDLCVGVQEGLLILVLHQVVCLSKVIGSFSRDALYSPTSSKWEIPRPFGTVMSAFRVFTWRRTLSCLNIFWDTQMYL